MPNTLKLNHDKTDILSFIVSAYTLFRLRSPFVSVRKAFEQPELLKSRCLVHFFYHLWSEAGRRETMYACSYKPGAWSRVYWSQPKGFHWRQQALGWAPRASLHANNILPVVSWSFTGQISGLARMPRFPLLAQWVKGQPASTGLRVLRLVLNKDEASAYCAEALVCAKLMPSATGLPPLASSHLLPQGASDSGE